MPSPYRSRTFRQAALAAAHRRLGIRAEERTPKQLEEELSEALEAPGDESTAARLNYGSIYARHNQRG